MLQNLNPRIILGEVTHNNKLYSVPLEWKENNGILIAGQSGSGKSVTAAFYLNQYAYWGTKLIICDFDSPVGEEETLSSRIDHLRDSFLLPPVSSPRAIKEYLKELDREYYARINDKERRFPIMFVIDEVSGFLSYIKEDGDSTLETFARQLLQMRKVGIRSMIIGQEWSSGFSTQLMRPIRSAFRVKVIHNLDAPNTKMVLDLPSTELIRIIGKQPTGHARYGDYSMKIPLLSQQAKAMTQTKLRQYVPVPSLDTADKVFLDAMFAKYGKNAGLDIKTKDDLIHFLVHRGLSPTWIADTISGKRADLFARMKEIRQELKLDL
jgi:hypothetical protein